MRRLLFVVVALLLALPFAASAQDSTGPMTWLAFNQLAEGKMGPDGLALVMEDKALMDALLADGVIVGHGVAIAYGMHVPEIHGVEGWTHRIWWALPSLEGIGKLKTAYAAAAGDTQAKVADLTVPGTHFDTIWMSFYVGTPPGD